MTASIREPSSFRLLVVLLTLTLGIACTAMPSEESVVDTDAVANVAAPQELTRQRAALMAERRQLKDATATVGAAAPAPTAPPQPSTVPGMVIRNGYASIEVDSLEVAVAAVRQLAATLGGHIGNVAMNTGEYAVRSATIEIKVPSARFDEAVTGLVPIGKVENSSSTAEDVGEEFVDVTARMTNARRLEERLVVLLATRTGKLEDVLAVERELARVREEIERYEGRLRFLRTRVATSTLTVTVHEPAPIVNPNPGTNIIGESVKNMWRNFVRLVAIGIESLGVVVPVALVGWLVFRTWRRRSRPAVVEAPGI